MEWMGRVPRGGFWTHMEKDAVGFDGKLKQLESSTIAGLVVKVAQAGGLVTTKSEETTAKGRVGNTPVTPVQVPLLLLHLDPLPCFVMLVRREIV